MRSLFASVPPALLLPLLAAATPAEPPAARAAPAEAPLASPAPADGELSDAQILIRARSMIEQDQARLRALERRSRDLARAFDAVSAEFARLDAELRAAREEPLVAREEEPPGAGDVGALEQRWTSVRAQLDLLIRRRQTVDQAMQILEAKRTKLQETIDLITLGQLPPEEDEAEPAAPAAPGTTPSIAARPTARDAHDRRVADARFELEERQGELRVAEQRARLVKELVALNQQDLTLAQVSAEASRSQQGLLAAQLQQLEEELESLRAAGGSAREQAALAQRIRAVRRTADETELVAADNEGLVASLEARLESLEPVRESILDHLEEAEDRVDAARRTLEFQQSPLAPHRLQRWGIETGPRIVALVAVLFGLWLLTRRLTRRLVSGAVSRSAYGSEEERLERVETLRRVFQNALTVAFVVIGALVLLPQFGIDATVLLGGAAVLSLAVAFGAQNLVQDYFSGVMILLENQYRVGNVIQINQDLSGVVEDVSLRMTTLRDLEGVAHFVPHSRIQTVSNMTHGWSRVALDIGVAYREDVDRVMAVLLELARAMRQEPEFAALIVDDPEMLGVDAFADSAVVIKLLVRTRPLKQWVVKRELLRRIKNRFDELGIEIPFPHRTVYHRDADSGRAGISAALK